MDEGRSHPIRNSVIASLITASVIGIVSLVPGGWWWVIGLGKGVLSWLTSTISLPAWCICVLVVAALTGIIVVAIAWITRREEKDPARNYREDIFFDIRWRWSFGYGGLDHLTSFCPHCDFQVFPRSSSAYAAVDRILYHCDECDRNLHEFSCPAQEVESHVIRKVQQEMRRKSREANAQSS